MSFVGDLLGLGGNKGGSFQAQSAPLIQGVNADQTNQAYGQAQLGLGQQQAFLNALQGQNGIANQSSVFNQLQGVANGTGPNPALQQLQNTTGQNVASQAALMAGQRGSGANAGLLARQAAQQGAGIQQQAVGQGAALQAQQQLNALGQLQGIAGQQVGQQANALTGYNQAAQSEQQNLLNALAQFNNANVSNTANQNSTNAQIQGQNASGQQSLFGGLLNGASTALAGPIGNLFKAAAPAVASSGAATAIGDAVPMIAAGAHGGIIQKYADGGMAEQFFSQPPPQPVAPVGPQSNAGKFLFGSAPSQQSANDPNPFQSMGQNNAGAQSLNKAGNSAGSGIGGLLGKGISAIGSLFAEGGPINGEMLAAQGKMVPGKAEVKGDSLKNDKVPAVLSPGEVVIPRSVMQSGDPVANSAKFVQAIMAKQNMRRKA